MPGKSFDDLAKDLIATQNAGDRRRLLGGIAATVGTLLVPEMAVPVTAKQVKNGERRRRRQRRRQQRGVGSHPFLKGIRVQIASSSKTLTHVEAGEYDSEGCGYLAYFDFPVPGVRYFDTSSIRAYVWVQRRYMFYFRNDRAFVPPYADVFTDITDFNYCGKKGTHVKGEYMELTGPTSRLRATIDGHYFAIDRRQDNDGFIVFRLELPDSI